MAQRGKPAPIPFTLEWRGSGDGRTYRVWRSNWFGDQFEILNSEEFDTLSALAKRFNIPFTEAGDD